MIIPIYKRSGQSTHLLAQQLGDMNHTKATHTGTLDPLAEGVVVVLTDQDRFNKSSFTGWKKTYKAQILLGISTDTDDELGIIFSLEKSISATAVRDFTTAFIAMAGNQNQLIHSFSAKRFEGKSYFSLAKSGTQPPDYYQSISIDSITLTSKDAVTAETLFKDQAEKVKGVAGNFRQDEIITHWQNIKNETVPEFFPVLEFSIVCSKRTYIRSLVRDVSQKTGVPAVLHNLLRTQNGPYSIADCMCLI